MKTVQKDILTVERGIIVHQVNAQGVAGAGLAKALFDKYPEAGRVYRGYKHAVGSVQFVPVTPHLWICNLVGQHFYGRDKQYTEYWAIRLGLMKVHNKFRPHSSLLMYFPYGMGCGLGGGDWSIVESLIEEIPNVIICRMGS